MLPQFTGAAVRGAITGLGMVMREPLPTQVFADAHGAAAWLAGRLGGDWTPARAEAAIESARRPPPRP